MPTCPNCSYSLVLLSYRGRYKWAKCSKLFSQKTIDNRSFRLWNQKQREIDLHNLLVEIKQKKPIRTKISRAKVSRAEQKQTVREYRKKYALMNKEKLLAYQRARYWKNHEQELERCRIYREKNTAKRNLTNKLWVAKNKDHHHQWLRSYLEKNKERDKLKKRLGYWRLQQAKLAEEILQNKVTRVYTRDVYHSFSTFGLSELLHSSFFTTSFE